MDEERKGKFSKNLVLAAVDFMRRCREEVGNDFTDERVNAMLDAFDPELKAQMFMEMLCGSIGIVSIKADGVYPLRKISCIKAVRRITGWGLKESKEFADGITEYHSETLTGGYSMAQIVELRDELQGTVYKIN